MGADLRYSSSALVDIEDIWRYTLEKWGTDQAERYTAGIEMRCFEIARGEAVTRSFVAKDADCRVARYEHHFIFFIADEEATIILAVLHERMDLIARIGSRLEAL